MLHAAGRCRAVREQEEKRPTTGLVKALCLPYDRKVRIIHQRQQPSTPTYEGMLGSISLVNTLYVWFPTVWMPLVVEAVRSRTVTCIRHTMQPGAVARAADDDIQVPIN